MSYLKSMSYPYNGEMTSKPKNHIQPVPLSFTHAYGSRWNLHLEGKSLILISTEGNLGQIPFSALPGKTHDSYLIEDYAIAMVPVPRLLPLLVARESVKRLSGGLLAVGGVAYDSVDQDFVAKSTKSKGWRTNPGITRTTCLYAASRHCGRSS
ncbi:MAG: CHAT domain-containing protein [Pirellulaceae bacterium]